ncbi:helicase [Methylobacterium indicum]|uniref:DEAD/DEAH box helicase n=1 Tax=Methylobacterium indicum TaxID=1775910 RepID=UPI000734E0EC|nr:DEAD/DEAH box helicase [Methylobacterium indicum]KTS23512.1 helicase [Methylobacterium indicum]KTS40187.1 helicase [Methylobacterium indicum]KTS52955.1 helicase [Methylobacterium indicum]
MPFPALPAPLAKALADRGYEDPTPVQAAVLEPETEGRDLVVSAQTGSGKTVAYGLALARTLLGDAEMLPAPGAPLALVIAPTRELALQVHRELSWLYGPAGARVVSCVGGMDPRRESRWLADGVHIVVGTPGRLRDHLERRNLDPSALRAAVLDEADEMLDLGFREDLEFILGATPAERRTLLFSATLPKAIVALAESYQRDAMRIAVAGETKAHADIEYRAFRILPRETELVVVNTLRQIEARTAIVFCNTRNSVRHLQAVLTERGFQAVALSGELGQGERNAALQALRDGRARVCVATDVAARGIDLPGLGLVIHAELPNDAEVMQHRSGRTGRAGRKGISVLLVPPSRRRRAEELMVRANVVPVWSGPPPADEIRALDHERLLQDPLVTDEVSDEDRAMAQSLLAQRSAEDIAAALVRAYRARMPSPEEVTDPGFATGRGTAAARRETTTRDGPRAPFGSSVWFRLNVGRRDNADPRRLLPMLCRRGDVTREEIGAIRIFDRETKFEVRGGAAERFAHTFPRTGPADLQVEALAGGEAEVPPRPRQPRRNAARRG